MDTSKIIKGVVNSGRYTVTAPIVKEDYGLYLQIEGVELPSTYEVDFSNSENSGTSVTMIGNADGVLIPSQFISTGKDIFAFLYHVGADFGRTIYKFRIPNKVRPDRTDETPTPEEQSTIDQAIYALNEAVEQTAQDVISADQSAQSAQGYAEQAETAKTNAQTYANNAQTSANNASASASQASASATASAQSASDAETARQATTSLVAEAQGYANASAQSAQASAQSASQAQQFAQTASLEAESAQDSATQADISANTASNKASEASGYASTASQKATEASQSASQALTYKNDAESAKTASQTAQGKAEDAQTAAETAQGKAEDAQEAAETAAASVQASAAQIAENTADIADLQTDVAQNEADILKAFPTDTASGAIASFTDGADNIPLKSLVVDINPVQDLSNGDPSPENLCPISGWTEIDINHSDADTSNPTTITIQLGQTVYGGKLDVLSGELVIDRAMVDLGTLNWTEKVDGVYATADLVGLTTEPTNYSTVPNIMCSIYTSDSYLNLYSNAVDHTVTVIWSASASHGQLWIRDMTYTDAETFKTAVTGQTLVYELAEPIEIQLSANQFNSLYGQNNLWADSGDTEVEYRADTKLFIERLTAPDSVDMVADANITSGKYFMVGNSLFKATANIANGAQIIVGTNCIRKSLSEALNEINA